MMIKLSSIWSVIVAHFNKNEFHIIFCYMPGPRPKMLHVPGTPSALHKGGKSLFLTDTQGVLSPMSATLQGFNKYPLNWLDCYQWGKWKRMHLRRFLSSTHVVLNRRSSDFSRRKQYLFLPDGPITDKLSSWLLKLSLWTDHSQALRKVLSTEEHQTKEWGPVLTPYIYMFLSILEKTKNKKK